MHDKEGDTFLPLPQISSIVFHAKILLAKLAYHPIQRVYFLGEVALLFEHVQYHNIDDRFWHPEEHFVTSKRVYWDVVYILYPEGTQV